MSASVSEFCPYRPVSINFRSILRIFEFWFLHSICLHTIRRIFHYYNFYLEYLWSWYNVIIFTWIIILKLKKKKTKFENKINNSIIVGTFLCFKVWLCVPKIFLRDLLYFFINLPIVQNNNWYRKIIIV